MSAKKKGIYLSGADQFARTPPELLKRWTEEFGLDYDPAPANRDLTYDGLSPDTEWGSCSFVNPPFSDIEPWLKRSVAEFWAGKSVVLLIPLRTNTRYWRTYLTPLLLARKAWLRFLPPVTFCGYDRPLATPLVLVCLLNGEALRRATDLPDLVAFVTPGTERETDFDEGETERSETEQSS